VVGARCAGASTARLLAQAGCRVLLVDRAAFPSDILSTHYIYHRGVGLLRKWGLLDAVRQSNCPAIERCVFDVGPCVLTGFGSPIDGIAQAFCPRRKVLDAILVDAAVSAGVELREKFHVMELLWDGDRVRGIRGTSSTGATVVERARLVIGADGLHSRIAKLVKAPAYNEIASVTCGYYTYFESVPLSSAELYARPYRGIGAFPTNDGLTCIMVNWPAAQFHEFRLDIEANYLKTLELAPSLRERVASGKRVERFYGTGGMPNYFCRAAGSGWALVGDAGYHKDAITAAGITDAFRQSEWLTDAIVNHGFEESALSEHYEKIRDTESLAFYEYTCRIARLEPPSPEFLALTTALRGNQRGIDQLLGTIAGTVSPAAFFDPANIARLMAEA
jgi:flavin-dependent dehydrogenase